MENRLKDARFSGALLVFTLFSNIKRSWRIILLTCTFYISVTIHIPLPKTHTSQETSEAPAAIASEAPEGTYLLPVTEQNKPDSPAAINLVLNLRLLMDQGNSTTVLNVHSKFVK